MGKAVKNYFSSAVKRGQRRTKQRTTERSAVTRWANLRSKVGKNRFLGDVVMVKARFDVEGPEHLHVIYKRLRSQSESLNGRMKARLALGRFTWQGMRNATMYVCLICCVVYAVAMVAALLGKPERQYSIAYFS